MTPAVGNVRFGSKADIGARPINVRFTPKSEHRLTREVETTQAFPFDFQSLAGLSRELPFGTEIVVAGARLFNS